ncbi:MAG: peptidase C39, partial [Oscillospiraceae bacterium]|nr:peptidase C39 [Oscillospiraceae bacterium]
MKTPLQYQITEYDCGPTSLLNALRFLFEREDIPPDVPKYIMMYCLDAYNSKGESGKNGTS